MGLRRVNRTIDVFDISLMAVVTKAMGAFLVMMLLLLPYYRSDPDFRTSTASLRQMLSDAQRHLAEMQSELAASRATDDPVQLRHLLDQARSGLDSAQKEIDRLSRQVDAMWSQLKQARDKAAEVEPLTSRLGESERESDRLRQALDQANAQAASLQQRLAADEAELPALRRDLAATRQEAQQAGPLRDQLQTARQAEDQLGGILSDARPLAAWREVMLFHPSEKCPQALAYSVFGQVPVLFNPNSPLGEQDRGFRTRSQNYQQWNMRLDGQAGAPPRLQAVVIAERATKDLMDYVLVKSSSPVSAGCVLDVDIIVDGAGRSHAFKGSNLPVGQSDDQSVLFLLFTKDGEIMGGVPTADDVKHYQEAAEQARKADEAYRANHPVLPWPAPTVTNDTTTQGSNRKADPPPADGGVPVGR